MPAALLFRRPDVRRAERLAAAQSAEIGVAESNLYPHFAVNGGVQLEAARFANLFNGSANASVIGPSFKSSQPRRVADTPNMKTMVKFTSPMPGAGTSYKLVNGSLVSQKADKVKAVFKSDVNGGYYLYTMYPVGG